MQDLNMFCFQCEQTAGSKACTGKAGVCGKTARTAELQDELTASLIDLAGSSKPVANDRAVKLMIEGLFTTVTNVSFDDEAIMSLIAAVRAETKASSRTSAKEPELSSMQSLWEADEDIRSLKSLILFGLRGMAAYAHHAYVLSYRDTELEQFLAEALRALAADLEADKLLALCLKLGEMNLKCMALLDQANTESYGMPSPAEIDLTVRKGPFIVVSGHDLKDLELLLKQTEGKGIDIYTHGEMLPAHGYPKLRAYSHLRGHFGTAWQNQKKEFADLPAPVLFTTNCLMPPMASYADRVFTTEMVGYPELCHIGSEKDFRPLIEKALELGGYSEDRVFTGINGGRKLTTGFGHGTILASAGTIVEAVKSGLVSHFFLVGGCDGAKPGRNYYTDFVKQTPADSLILTLACGKFRFNDLDMGSIGGFPRIMDMGQCNDAYGAIRVAVALAEAFNCSVNDLPLSIVLSWYEQKAVCILLTLLHLGIHNIVLGPTLPAFVSPNILDFLVKNFGIRPTTTAEADLKRLLAQ